MDISFGFKFWQIQLGFPLTLKEEKQTNKTPWHSGEQFCCMWSFLEPEKYANTQALLIFFKLLCIDNRIKTKSRNYPENCLTIMKREKTVYYFILFYFILYFYFILFVSLVWFGLVSEWQSLRKKSSCRVQWGCSAGNCVENRGGNIQKYSFKKGRQRQRGEKRRGLIPLKLAVLWELCPWELCTKDD